jgi:anti-sigma-K factor RskA
MGSSGQKRSRKAKKGESGKPHHLPKVGTATEERYAQNGERRAVMENLGIDRNASPVWRWTIAIVAVLFVIAAVVALVAID